jgi:hypothetical protein
MCVFHVGFTIKKNGLLARLISFGKVADITGMLFFIEKSETVFCSADVVKEAITKEKFNAAFQ